MKKNKFGEVEKKHSKINIMITVIAVIAIMITGVLYSISLRSAGAEASIMETSEDIS